MAPHPAKVSSSTTRVPPSEKMVHPWKSLPLSRVAVRTLTEDREEWHKELQRHCDEVYPQIRRRRKKYKKTELNFTEEGRTAEITLDLVLQAGAKMSDNKVNGPQEAIVSDMIKQLPLEKDLHHYEVFSRTLLGSDGISKFVKDCETGLLEKAGC